MPWINHNILLKQIYITAELYKSCKNDLEKNVFSVTQILRALYENSLYLLEIE